MVDVRQSENNERITFIKYLYGFETYMDIYTCVCVCVYLKKYFGFTAVEKIKIICTFKPVNYQTYFVCYVAQLRVLFLYISF